MLKRVSVATICALAVAACTSPAKKQRDMRARQADAFLQRVGPVADPGKVAARDIAYARAARDNGQWTAAREFSASNALLLDGDGQRGASSWLAGRADPSTSLRWAPTEIWSSCDGTLAASFGVSQDAGGIVGTYLRIWQWEGSGTYRWTYSAGTPDMPQPPPPAPEIEPDEDTIIVAALDAIQARTADCQQVSDPDEGFADAPPPPLQGDAGQEPPAELLQASRDGTLAWRVEQPAADSWVAIVDWQRDGSWQEAVRLTIPDPAGE